MAETLRFFLQNEYFISEVEFGLCSAGIACRLGSWQKVGRQLKTLYTRGVTQGRWARRGAEARGALRHEGRGHSIHGHTWALITFEVAHDTHTPRHESTNIFLFDFFPSFGGNY